MQGGDVVTVHDLGASADHEQRKLEAVEVAAAVLAKTVQAQEAARDARDRAVRAAVTSGIPPGRVAKAAGLSAGRVSHLTTAPRST